MKEGCIISGTKFIGLSVSNEGAVYFCRDLPQLLLNGSIRFNTFSPQSSYSQIPVETTQRVFEGAHSVGERKIDERVVVKGGEIDVSVESFTTLSLVCGMLVIAAGHRVSFGDAVFKSNDELPPILKDYIFFKSPEGPPLVN